jgi:TP901 family phage tail tape measure protein
LSELIAEARVLVTPDTAAFRQLLIAQTTTAAAGVTVPVAVTPIVSGGAGAAGLAAQERALITQIEREREALTGADVARRRSADSAGLLQRRLSALTTGASSSALSLVGLRGATLAATGPFLAGAAGAIAFSKAISTATSFNSEIAVLGAVTGATAEELERASEAAKQFGRDITLPGVTAGDAAKTITEFSKAGLSLNDSIAATRGGLQLAQAAQLSFEEAVTLSAGALNAFNLSGNEAVRVADVLANAANLAQGGIQDTGLALRQAASAAAVVGVSFEDTAALLTLLARNGLTGSDAGTALRTSFLRLVNPSKEAAKILKDLNVQLRDANGNVRPEIFAEFAEAQRNLAVSTQQANAAIVFGQDAFRAFGILGQEGRAGLAEVSVGLDETGTAARIAQARMVGLAGETANLSNQLENLGLTLGQAATPAVEAIVKQLADAAAAANEFAEAVGEIKGAFDELPGPDTSDFGDAFTEGLFEGLKNLNPQAAEIFRFIDVIKEGTEDGAEAVVGAGAELRSAIEQSSRNAAAGARDFGDQIIRGFNDAFAGINAAIAARAREFRAAQLQAVRGGLGQAAGLDEAFNQIVAGGATPQEQVSALRRQAVVQAKIIEDAGPNAAGVLLEARRTAQEKLASINTQIVSIEKSIAAERKSALDEANRIAEEAQREADQAFLGRQQDVRSQQERRVGLADETEGLQDDIKRRQGLRTLITQQIASLRQSAVDEKTKQAAIKVLVAAKQSTSDEINKLVRTQAQLNREQREAAQEEREAADIALAQSILDLTGNKNPMLRALDAAIKDSIKERNAAKKGSVAFKNAQTEINNFLKQRKDLLEETEEEAKGLTGGTTLVDLFNENQRIFDQAGNVGSFRDLTGSAANAQIRTTVETQLQLKSDPQVTRQTDAIDRLINSIDRLNENLTDGNATTGGRFGNGDGPRNVWHSITQEQRFFFAQQARDIVTSKGGV